jgi:hypothetical protein
MRVGKNKIIGDFLEFTEFCKAVEKAIPDRKFVYLEYDGSQVTLFCEGETAKVRLSATVKEKYPAFSAGVEASKFLAAFKKLYQGDITLQLDKSNKILLTKDNIKIRFPIVAGRAYPNSPECTKLFKDQAKWIVEGLIRALSSIEEMGKKGESEKMRGVLFETTLNSTRLAKFSASSLYFSSSEPMFQEAYRIVFPDIMANLAKTFPKDVEEVFLGRTTVGFKLKYGSEVYCSMPYDNYPKEYISTVHLNEDVRLIPESLKGYIFRTDALLNAVDLVSTTLGDDESWVTLETVGKSEESLVWKIGGKSYTQVEASEKVLSTEGAGILQEAFSVNKKKLIKCLSTFGEEVYVYDLSRSALALSDRQGCVVTLLTKAAI